MNAKGTGLVEVGERVGIVISHDGEGAFVDGVEGDFGSGDGLIFVVEDGAGDLDHFTGAGFALGGGEVDLEAGTGGINGEFAVAEAELGFGAFALGVGRAFDDEDGDEGIGGVDFLQGDFNDRIVESELGAELSFDLLVLDGDEGFSFDGREDENAGGLTGEVAFFLGDELDAHAIFVGPGILFGAIDVTGDDGFEGAAGGVLRSEGEEMFSGFSRSEGEVEFALCEGEFAREDRGEGGFVFDDDAAVGGF